MGNKHQKYLIVRFFFLDIWKSWNISSIKNKYDLLAEIPQINVLKKNYLINY